MVIRVSLLNSLPLAEHVLVIFIEYKTPQFYTLPPFLGAHLLAGLGWGLLVSTSEMALKPHSHVFYPSYTSFTLPVFPLI